ncbi:MAG: DUF5011 domain-containing protein, partial [Candidatus Kerfeldbacteria bacterium]|nr:DUF5011 domain-containing protein [Candidatus Kerfeldbacteria bacterium]
IGGGVDAKHAYASSTAGAWSWGALNDSLTTFTERMRLTTAGNLGIGTTSPYAKLSVVGEAVASYFTATTTATSTFPRLLSTNATTSSLAISNITSGSVLFAGTGGEVKQNNTSLLFDNATSRLSVGTNSDVFSIAPLNIRLDGAAFTNLTDASATLAIQNQSAGVNTGATLSFYGYDTTTSIEVAKISSKLTSAAGAGTMTADLLFGTSLNSTLSEGMRLTSAGRLGIGTTSPGALFSVQGSGLFSGNVHLNNLTATGTSVIFSLIPSGAGVGTICYNTGGSLATSTSGCTGSSLRFKENINDLSYGLSDVGRLRPVSFTYKEGMGASGPQIGFIAEEMVGVIPEVVGYDREGRPANIDYAKLAPLLIKAVQELSVKVDMGMASTTMWTLDYNTGYLRLKDYTGLDIADKNIINVRRLISSSGKWSFSDDGLLVDTLEVKGNVKVGSPERRSGITLYDEKTGDPYCLRMSSSIVVSSLGECSSEPYQGEKANVQGSTLHEDVEPPFIALLGNATSTLNVGDSYVDPGATVTDNIDHNLGFRTSGLVDTGKAGEYILHYDATDSAGNKAVQLSRVVTIVGRIRLVEDSSIETASSTEEVNVVE